MALFKKSQKNSTHKVSIPNLVEPESHSSLPSESDVFISSTRRTIHKDIPTESTTRIVLERVKSIEPMPEETFAYVPQSEPERLPEPEPPKSPDPKPLPPPEPVVEKPRPTYAPPPVIDHAALKSEAEAYKAQLKQEAQREIEAYKQSQFEAIDAEKSNMLTQGYHDGFDHGESESSAKLAQGLKDYLQAINQVADERNQIFKDAKEQILKLAVAASEQMVHNELSLNPAVCLDIITEALNRITEKDKVIIRVGSEDVDFVNEHREDLLKKLPDIRSLSVQEDHRIEDGGCIIETSLGYIDATIKTKLSLIEKALLAVYEEELKEKGN